jgi:hypothetical protein
MPAELQWVLCVMDGVSPSSTKAVATAGKLSSLPICEILPLLIFCRLMNY